MTEQFYALHGKEYIIRQRLSREWKELLQLPNEEQTMERGEETEREIRDRHTGRGVDVFLLYMLQVLFWWHSGCVPVTARIRPALASS